ncbi:hypothetical protein V2A60_004512 [Cordyceps javanica]|uniref:C6 zinc finger domain-containing protein n=1 Tax=Cordyceps javanica TaxID=43265 RepID=A0A545US02_9HYPO|nr:C6 zinc finger domain-containing protein [Cordyceps javanica]TQW03988.1 C6 zinc finger domain-containing protein [Cordyceps javanica]
MQRYNDAIAALNSLLSSETNANLETVLVCCVIFITIENMNGRSAEAACHLRAGCGILKRLRQARPRATNAVAGHGNVDGLLLALEDMLYYFGQFLAIYVGLDAFVDLDFNIPVLSMGDPDVPFASLKEAEMMFRNIDQTFYTRMWNAQAYSPQPASLSDMFLDRTKSLESQGPSMDLRSRRAAKAAAKSDLAIWKRRFEPLVRESPDRRSVTALSMDYAVWRLITGGMVYGQMFSAVECQAALSLAEVIISMDATTTHPRFTFDGNLVWTLFYICFGSDDALVHERCIRLLHAANRREGVWDSCDVAEICQTAVSALNNNTLAWKDIPHGMLTLSDMLQVKLRGFSLASVRALEAEDARRGY